MAMRISTAARNAACDAVVDLVDSGGGTAKLQLWSGSMPGSFGDTPSGNLLAEFDLPNPCFGAASNGVATANVGSISPTQGEAAAGAGTTVGFVRVVNANGDVVWENDSVGTGGGAQIVLNTTTISAGADVSVTSWTVTMPAS